MDSDEARIRFPRVEDRIGEEPRGFQYNSKLGARRPLAPWGLAKRLCSRTAAMVTQKEFHVDRLVRKSMLFRIEPIGPRLIKCCIAEKVPGLPKAGR